MTYAKIPGQKIVIPQDQFYPCLSEWLETDLGKHKEKNFVMKSGQLIGWREFVTPIKTENNYEDGKTYLSDLQQVLRAYGLEESYAYSTDMLTMEMFGVLINETILSTVFSLAAITVVVFLITGSRRTSAIVLISVAQTDFFLVAMIPLVGLQFNNVVVVYIIASLGFSVLYAVQVTHTFLLIDAPLNLSVQM